MSTVDWFTTDATTHVLDQLGNLKFSGTDKKTSLMSTVNWSTKN